MIVQLRGCSGSGKSTVAHTLLAKFPNEPLVRKKDGKIMAYKVEAGLDKPIYVVGSYHTACGGVDTIPTIKEALDRVAYFDENNGHVFFEGLLISTIYGSVGEFSDRHEMVFAILDTPLDVCLERVRLRRLEKGNDKPMDPKNTIAKWNMTQSHIEKFRGFGKRVEIIDHNDAFNQVMSLFKESK